MAYVLTLVAARAAGSLGFATVDRVRDAVRGGVPLVLSDGEAADIPVQQPPDLGAVRAALEDAPVDVFRTRAHGRRRKLLIADMDGTIVAGETLDELAEAAGVGEAVAAITARSMNGEIDFREALRARVAMLRGLRLDALAATYARTRLNPGARTLVATMRAHGARTVLVTGGFDYFASRVAALCGFDMQCSNRLLDDGTALTGAVAEPILDRDSKRATLLDQAHALGLRPQAALALGDGANDLAMLREAGLGIGYRPKPVVAAAIENAIHHADLRSALFAQGYRAGDFRE